ncbi:MBL fold metallo-hydrolase [Actinoplanes sp. NPDC049599]|uniref:MBL fold metallo-hydrolase n=1 Tax=Actinoplanes sp. NPDC049599 TaxID=3363903 RepID=UPI0037A25552
MSAIRKIGPLTVIALQDAEGPHFDRREDALPEATAAQWAAADARDPAARAADGRWWLRFRSFAIRYGESGPVTLVDAGIGPAHSLAADWAPVPGHLPAELAAAGIRPAEVEAIVLTHLHTDHIGWAVPADSPFTEAQVIVQQAEVDAFAAARQQDTLLRPLREQGRLRVVSGDTRLGEGVRIVSTPGHTPGHQSVLVESGAESMLITGDLLVHAVQLIDPGLAYGHDMDTDLARESREAALATAATRDSWLAVSHLGQPYCLTKE